jgi:glycosyltransferase involved in cell wall biosynthesis
VPDICILSHLHISTNPRVWKEANAFAKKGYTVTVITNFTSAEKLEYDQQFIQHPNIQYKAVLNLIPNGRKNFIPRNWNRLKRKSLELMKQMFGWEHPDSITFSTKKFLQSALKENAKLYIGHLEGGLIAGVELLKYQKQVAFDMEDWYSQDFISATRPVKMLEKYEKVALTKGVYISCPSASMAKEINSYYNISLPIHVIYNGFSVSENNCLKPKEKYALPRLVWFSQTVGSGRGLETLMQSLQMVNTPLHLNLIGNCAAGYKKLITNMFPFQKGHVLQFQPLVKHTDLLGVIANNEIGLAIENSWPQSRNTTITNKILQYMQAGLRVLATDTMGQVEVAEKADHQVQIVTGNDPLEWAEKIEQMIMDTPPETKNKSYQLFINHYCWELQEQKLVSVIEKIIKK